MSEATDDFEAYLRPTEFIDSDHPRVAAFAERAAAGSTDEVERAVRIFGSVRDDIRYAPYGIVYTRESMTASHTLEAGRGFCVQKAILLAATARAAGIPSRLGFADVRNHLVTERLRKLMGTDLFIYHGYTELYVGGKWLKATPAFNRELCDRFGVPALDFDGRSDAVFQPYDTRGRLHMEYVRDHGPFPDLPFEMIERAYIDTYPQMFGPSALPQAEAGGDFYREAEDEAQRPGG